MESQRSGRGDCGVSPEEITAWIAAGKGAIDLIRSSLQVMPKGPKKDELEAQVRRAEEALQASNVQLAKALGYKLCRCTFPPQIMLWKAADNTNICPQCETKDPPPPETHRVPDHDPDWIAARHSGRSNEYF
jgi:hypothetical protein